MDRIIKTIISFILVSIFTLCLPFGSMAAESKMTAQYLMKNVPDPTCDSVGGEWTVIGLAGCDQDVPQEYFDCYYHNLEEIVKEKKGVLSEDSYTEYSRAVMALSAIGRSALNVSGYDLARPLQDYEKVTAQGLNGAIYALLALDKGGYVGPRKELRASILEKELPGGGWSFWGSGPADPDMTAMAVQALSRYRYHKNVGAAIDRAVSILSDSEYTSSETISQVIIAMDSIGIIPSDGLRKQLMKYRLGDGSFRHSLTEDEGNIMSTEQALIAMNALAHRK